jgi:hypothetical protein
MCSSLLLHVPIVLPLSFRSWMRRSGGAGRRASGSSSQSAAAGGRSRRRIRPPLARLRTAVEAGRRVRLLGLLEVGADPRIVRKW